MDQPPMGFGPDGRDDDSPDQQPDPLSALFGDADPHQLAEAMRAAGVGDVDPAQLSAMIGQVQQLMAAPGDGGPVNWELVQQIARQVVAEHGDPSVGEAQRRAVDEAVRLADLWLADVTTLPAAGVRTLAWCRAEWVEGTLPVWRHLVEPVARSVGTALTDALAGQLPEQLSGALPGAGPGGPMDAVMRQISGSVFGMQVGHAVGALATEVVSGTEIGLPLVDPGVVVLLPEGVAAFGAGLDVPADEVRLYLALREAARARLFAHVPWLSAALVGAVQEYARGIAIDTGQVEAAMRDIDPTDPGAMQQALTSGLFEPERSPAQQAALDRLETSLALLEGWVETVTDDAAHALPHAGALRETVRRRRASAGPAEQTFAALVGLELRPRRLRDAAALWRVIGDERGVGGRDALWAHPDLMPTTVDLDDPLGHAQRSAQEQADSSDVDSAIERMLSQE